MKPFGKPEEQELLKKLIAYTRDLPCVACGRPFIDDDEWAFDWLTFDCRDGQLPQPEDILRPLCPDCDLG
jgi:hypothetical protein